MAELFFSYILDQHVLVLGQFKLLDEFTDTKIVAKELDAVKRGLRCAVVLGNNEAPEARDGKETVKVHGHAGVALQAASDHITLYLVHTIPWTLQAVRHLQIAILRHFSTPPAIDSNFCYQVLCFQVKANPVETVARRRPHRKQISF